jgi:hypothetical protein
LRPAPSAPVEPRLDTACGPARVATTLRPRTSSHALHPHLQVQRIKYISLGHPLHGQIRAYSCSSTRIQSPPHQIRNIIKLRIRPLQHLLPTLHARIQNINPPYRRRVRCDIPQRDLRAAMDDILDRHWGLRHGGCEHEGARDEGGFIGGGGGAELVSGRGVRMIAIG